MKMKKMAMATLVVIGLMAMIAQASPLVTLDIQASGGNWEVYAEVSGYITTEGDNQGLAVFDLDVTGTGGLTVDTSLNKSPVGAVTKDYVLFPQYGFAVLREDDDGTVGLGIAASQPLVYSGTNDPEKDALVIQGIGQTAGTYTPYSGYTVMGSPASWADPVLLAEGTYTGTVGTLTAAAGEAPWIVLKGTSPWEGPGVGTGEDKNLYEAGFDGDSIYIPEPATMLVLLGGALLAVIRRR